MAAMLGAAGGAAQHQLAERLQRRFGASWRSLLVLAAIAAFLLLLLIVPVGTVFVTAFRDGDGSFTLGHFATFFSTGLMRESFFNSLYVATVSVIVASLIAVPLAYLTVRFQFRGAALIQTLGVLPLIMPPFVGAVAMQLVFGRSGSVNLLLEDHFGFSIPIMQGLTGVIFVESLHYFPFILMNLIVSLRAIDGAMEEAALNLGARGWRLFRRVVFPLAMPGYLAGAALVFVKVFDDLGTPLVLGQTNLLAPQAYLRITQVGLEDPLGYVISVIMIAFSILALWLSVRVMKGKDYSTLQKGGAGIARRRLKPWESALAYARHHPRAAGRAEPAPGPAGAVVRQGLELLGAARRLDPGQLRHRVRGLERHDPQHAAVLRPGGADRRRHRHGDRVPDPAHAHSGAPVARLCGECGDCRTGHRAGDRLPAHLPGCRDRRRAGDTGLGADHAGLRRAPPAVRACARAWQPCSRSTSASKRRPRCWAPASGAPSAASSSR